MSGCPRVVCEPDAAPLLEPSPATAVVCGVVVVCDPWEEVVAAGALALAAAGVAVVFVDEVVVVVEV